MSVPVAPLVSTILLTMSNPQPVTEYLGSLMHRVTILQQGWGELGIDTCAYAPGQTPLALRIKDRTYSRGLGHHAPGEIVFDLNGEYALFEAEVGVQWQQGNLGSVLFQVYVDGKKRFDSGVMRETDPPKRVRVVVEGADELRLVVTDAGDGITCDCANWADARLTRSASPKPRTTENAVDVAPFSRVVTSDPQRMDGARASRIEEYHAEDVFQDIPLPPDTDGIYTVPTSAGQAGAIGLHWLERRQVTELRLRFAHQPPPPESVQIQVWVGESHWQGKWTPIQAELQADGFEWRFRPDWRGVPGAMQGVRKIRWVFAPTPQPVRVQRISAFTKSRWEKTELTLRMQSPTPQQSARIQIYNGEILVEGHSSLECVWQTPEVLRLQVRYSRPSLLKSDRTVLWLTLPDGAFGVAVDDVLEEGAVFVPHVGLLVSRDRELTIERYRQRIARRRTVLDRVRRLPEQTYAQAMEKTHRAVQNNGPMMLSLACDNRKFIVERDGAIRWGEYQIQLVFGRHKAQWQNRHLYGGWLPAPVIVYKEGDVTYRQTTFVAPLDREPLPDSNGWLHQRAACISVIDVHNGADQPADALVLLRVKPQVNLERHPRGYVLKQSDRFLAPIQTEKGDWHVEETPQGILLSCRLPKGSGARWILIVPAWQCMSSDLDFIDSEQALSRMQSYWEAALQDAMQIEVPEPEWVNVVRASQVHCLIAARNEQNGKQVAAWIASDAYGPLESEAHAVIRGMMLMGHLQFARRALDYFVQRYHPAGYLTTGYTLMGTGWHLWTLGEYFALTGDREWMEQIAPSVNRVCRWIMQQRQKTMKMCPNGKPVAEYGLMPPGVLADWNAFAYYFTLNGYYYAGLKHAARALADIGYGGAEELLREAERFCKDILRAFRHVQARMPVVPLQNGTYVLGAPSQVHCPAPTGHFFPGEDANRSWAYDVELGAIHLIPQGVLSADSADANGLMNFLEDVSFLENGWFDYPAAENRKDWFNLGGFSKVQPYYTRTTEVYALRDDVKPFIRSYFNSLASLLNRETLWLWEHFNNVGAWNKTHETGYFLQQTRWMFAMERGDTLWLAPFIPSYWLRDGCTVSVRNLLTLFGVVSYRMHSRLAHGVIETELNLPSFLTVRKVCLRLNHPQGKRIKQVQVNGQKHTAFDAGTVFLSTKGGVLHLKVSY